MFLYMRKFYTAVLSFVFLSIIECLSITAAIAGVLLQCWGKKNETWSPLYGARRIVKSRLSCKFVGKARPNPLRETRSLPSARRFAECRNTGTR